ncbi:MAG: hypothetical protein AB8F95_10415 [Bacteroidia bacterium]
MSYPPLRSWPMSKSDFPPPEQDHWFNKFQKWFWLSALTAMSGVILICSTITCLSESLLSGFYYFILMVGMAVLCLVGATIIGFGVGAFSFGKLPYEKRVEVAAGAGTLVLFGLGAFFGITEGWYLFQ